MSLEDYFIPKEEIDLAVRGESFQLLVPIAPILLEKTVHIDPDIAPRVFPHAIKEFQERLTHYKVLFPHTRSVNFLGEDYLTQEISCAREGQRISAHPIPGGEVTWHTDERGFAYALSIGRNSGGSLYFTKDTEVRVFHPGAIHFSAEKVQLYTAEKRGEFSLFFHYQTHNVDSPLSALLLLSWGRQYLNAALECLLEQRNNPIENSPAI